MIEQSKKYSILFFNEDECRNMGSTEAYIVAINNKEVLMDVEITEEQLFILSEQEKGNTISQSTVQKALDSIEFSSAGSYWDFDSNNFKEIINSVSHDFSKCKKEYKEFLFTDKAFVTIGMGHEGICLGQFEIQKRI